MAQDNTGFLFENDDSAPQQGRVIQVAFDSGADAVFDYLVPDALWPVEIGRRITVPFGRSNKPVTGFCINILDDEKAEKSRAFRLKSVKNVIDDIPLIDEKLMSLAHWISNYYFCPLGQVLAAMLPAAVKKGIGLKKEKYIFLDPDAQIDISQIRSKKQKSIIEILQEHESVDPESAILKSELLEMAGCTDSPLKKLIQGNLIKVSSQEIINAPPAVPESLTMKSSDVILNNDQQKALDEISKGLESNKFGVYLLHGVTDSGKTEIYIRAIEKTVAAGKQAIILLPEISLTAQTINRFSSRFKNIAVMHCQLTASQRHSQWRKIKDGQADVVIGARSAVFAPIQNLGLIVVDEEHESSYKQDTVPRYHGRDTAIIRAQQSNAICLLGTATPSLETLHNCETKEHFKLLSLPNRVCGLPMPEMKTVDMKYQKSKSGQIPLISDKLREMITDRLAKKEQTILLLNRRGYSSLIYCPRCNHSLHCRNCDVTLTFHKRKLASDDDVTRVGARTSGYAICHYCMSKTLVPDKCPICSGTMSMIGYGSQKLLEELKFKIPSARVMRIDSDTMEGAGGSKYYKMLEDFSKGNIDILAGTQIIAKGLHFPNVTLVGIISADTALAIPDFRSNERTFQLISQVAGRAGRTEKGGQVIVQTFMPDQPAIKHAIDYDFEGFVTSELETRKTCCLPPYWRMARIGLRDEKFDRLEAACQQMARRIAEIVNAHHLELKVRGPMPAAISRKHNQHRMQIVIQGPSAGVVQGLFAHLRTYKPIRPAVTVTVDMDPVSLL